MKWLPWLIFALFGYFLLGNNFSAKLGMIDDHEIAHLLGSDGKISLYQIPSVIMGTEVGQWGKYLRFRPSYYMLRVVEASLWGDNATLWYISRYLMIVLSMWIGFQILLTYFPNIISYLFVFYAMTMPFWPDLLTRLGPSEIYTIPAILLFVYGMMKNRLWMLAIGYTVCVGAKENFLILFPLLLLWSASRAYTKKLTRGELITTIILTLYTLTIVGAILVATAKAGTDIYGTQISYRYRITKFVWDIPKIVWSRHMIPSLLVFLAGIVVSVKKIKSSPIAKHVALMLTILVVIASQYVFYVNQLPSNMRYDFPALLLFPILDLVAMSMIITYFAKHKSGTVIKIGLYGLMMLIFSFYILHRGYDLIHLQSIKNTTESRGFERVLQSAQKMIKENPSTSIVFVSERFIDFEPIVSVARYLNANGVSNQFQLYYNPPKTTNDPMELDDRLKQVMMGNLGTDHVFDRFSKYREARDKCFSITFGSSLPLSECPEIARF
ncbi:hypothetical protein KBD75_04590 [Candidatus Woesebacteria bacterium]|nr:hypothetical protein [Candidatus Woesebacteria bacterium]